MNDLDHKELLRLLELDYEKTTKSIEGVIGTTFTIRGWGITLVSALIGFTFQTRRWEISVLAAAITFLIAAMDGYHSWIYAKLLQQAHNVERVLKLYYAALARGEDDPQATRDYNVAILAHRFGRFAEVQRFGFHAFREIRPRVIFFGLYGTLFAAAGLAFTLVRVAEPTAIRFECKSVENAKNVFVCVPK